MDGNAHIFFCGMFVKLFVAAYVFLPMQKYKSKMNYICVRCLPVFPYTFKN